MEIKVNENTILKIHKDCEKEVLREGMVWCYQVDCYNNDIGCCECYLDGLGDSALGLDYSKVKVGE